MRALPFLFLIGCAIEPTPEAPVPVAPQPEDVRIAIGGITDGRLKEDGAKLSQKQIQIGSAKVKNTIAEILTRSKHFSQVVNLTPESSANLSSMLEAARSANCHYLILGEMDQFDVIELGANKRMGYAIALEALTFPVGVIVFLLSERKAGIWINGIVYDHSVEALISVSFHVVEVETGKTVGHLSNRTSRAMKPVNALVYGDLANPADDWIDIGKELGLVSLHNLAVALIEPLRGELRRIRGR